MALPTLIHPGKTRNREVVLISLLPVSERIAAAERELAKLREYPVERLADIIRDVGFRCDHCARCCTRAFNGHVFLLDCDVAVAREIDHACIEPAPFPEFCDQNGTFYVSGYALRAKDDDAKSCIFLDNGLCRIYDRRFSICRVYPYMLHREPDRQGRVDWRQISGLDEHGEYHTDISRTDCRRAAEETREYEAACLLQELAFLRYMKEYFSENRLRHVQKVYDDRMRAYGRGEEIRIMVFSGGRLEEHRIRIAGE